MKTLKFISVLGLFLLAVCSCKKEDNSLDEDDIPVKFNQFGMQAYFPKDAWGNQTGGGFDIPGYETECISAYLKESEFIVDGEKTYSVYISFSRFVAPFEDDSAYITMTNDIKDIYDYHTGSDYLSVDTLISSSIGDYSALELDAVKINNAVEESYFIYQGKRLYWISLIIPEDKMNLYYNECKEILNTLKITD